MAGLCLEASVLALAGAAVPGEGERRHEGYREHLVSGESEDSMGWVPHGSPDPFLLPPFHCLSVAALEVYPELSGLKQQLHL